ncbi:hypothetical protein D3C87_1811140 [compost metagenome]
MRLADAVGAVGGLVFYRRVPPGVVVDHRVGLRQVEPHATGLEADQEQRHLPAGELFDDRVAFLALPRELDPGQVALFQLRLDQREHAGEL